jgi:hypothetical protein
MANLKVIKGLDGMVQKNIASSSVSKETGFEFEESHFGEIQTQHPTNIGQYKQRHDRN